MNNLGPFGLAAIAVLVAALFALVGAIPVLVVRNLITRRPAATHLREWLLYVLGAALLIIAFVSSYLYAERKGIDEYTTVKWMNILITAAIVFGPAAKKFWRLRTNWTFWAVLCVLTVGHFALLSRLHWQQASYFSLPVVAGIPELALVIVVLGLAFDPTGNLTKPKKPLFDSGWELPGIRSAEKFFSALPEILPLPANLCFEGTSITSDVQSLLSSNAATQILQIAPGTIWPKPSVFHVRATEQFLNQLAALAGHHAGPEICDHFHAYNANQGLVQWYDAFSGDALLVAESIPEVKVQIFSRKLGVSYSPWRFPRTKSLKSAKRPVGPG